MKGWVEETWLKRIVDPKGDGNCLLYSLLVLFPNVTLELSQELSTRNKQLHVHHLIYELRREIVSWGKGVLSQYKEEGNPRKDKLQSNFINLHLCGTPLAPDVRPELNQDKTKPDIVEENLIGDALTKFERYLGSNLLPWTQTCKIPNYTRDVKDDKETLSRIQKRSPPEESYFLHAFCCRFNKTVVCETVVLNEALVFTYSPDGSLHQSSQEQGVLLEEKEHPTLFSCLPTGYTYRHFRFYTPVHMEDTTNGNSADCLSRQDGSTFLHWTF